MVDPQVRPQVVVDPPPAQEGQHQQQTKTTQTYAEPRVIIDKADEAAYRHALLQQQRKPAGPQIWAVVFTLAGLYYIWTRVLGKPLPSRASLRGGQKIGINSSLGRSGAISSSSSNSNRQAEIAAARERQQQRLELMAKAKEHKNNDGNSNLRERTNINSGNSKLSINQQQQLLQQQKEQKQKAQVLEEKKKKQRGTCLFNSFTRHIFLSFTCFLFFQH